MNKRVITGLPVSGGTVTGKVRVITNFSQVGQVEEGEILVLPKSHPAYAVGVMKAGGLICEEGGVLAHICVVALEMGIPCITRAGRSPLGGNWVRLVFLTHFPVERKASGSQHDT